MNFIPPMVKKKIALIFSKERADTIGIYFEKTFKDLQIPYEHFCSSQMDKIPKDYVLYFRISDPHVERVLPNYLKPAIYWTGDVHLESSLNHLKKQAGQYDLVLTCLPQGIEKLKPYARSVYFVSYACDPDIHRKLDLTKKYDIGFVGTDGGVPRKFILEELRERFPRSYMGLSSHLNISSIYSQSKIGFNYPIRLEGLTMRSFEIASCGAFQIMPKLTSGWMETLGFENGKNIVVYESLEELDRLIRFYLKHDKERETIAKLGYELVSSRHTYRHKVLEILKLCRNELDILT